MKRNWPGRLRPPFARSLPSSNRASSSFIGTVLRFEFGLARKKWRGREAADAVEAIAQTFQPRRARRSEAFRGASHKSYSSSSSGSLPIEAEADFWLPFFPTPRLEVTAEAVARELNIRLPTSDFQGSQERLRTTLRTNLRFGFHARLESKELLAGSPRPPRPPRFNRRGIHGAVHARRLPVHPFGLPCLWPG